MKFLKKEIENFGYGVEYEAKELSEPEANAFWVVGIGYMMVKAILHYQH